MKILLSHNNMESKRKLQITIPLLNDDIIILGLPSKARLNPELLKR